MNEEKILFTRSKIDCRLKFPQRRCLLGMLWIEVAMLQSNDVPIIKSNQLRIQFQIHFKSYRIVFRRIGIVVNGRDKRFKFEVNYSYNYEVIFNGCVFSIELMIIDESFITRIL